MPRRLIFDIEGDGLLDTVTRIHCIAAVDPDTGERLDWKPDQLSDAYSTLQSANTLYAHFGIGYDYRALDKVAGVRFPTSVEQDTVVAARLIHPDLKTSDTSLVRRGVLPGNLHGSHKLEAWGRRLNCHKAAYEGPWDVWSPEMHDYMIQDVEATYALWKHLDLDKQSQQALTLEHRIARVCNEMTAAGWPFDRDKAVALHAQMQTEYAALERELVAEFGTWQEIDKVFVPKRDNARFGYKAGVEVTKYKDVTFNPTSRQHIFKKLMELGWKPEVFTDSGLPRVDDAVLETLADDFPPATKIARYLMLSKRLGQLADGNQAWLRVLGPDGLIHASYNPNGAVTGRASHFNPNIAQVPALKNRKGGIQPFGRECRELFHVPEGWVQLGADMSGLELRCLAHYLAPMDGGEYARVLLEGDIHSFNQRAAGLPARDMAKTFIYAWLYGAGAAKIGKIVNGTAAQGRALIEQFLEAVPAVATLKGKVANNVGIEGQLRGLDKRLLPIRSEHAALNTLLQSAGAVLCKQWVCDAYDTCSQSYTPGWSGDFVFLGWIHDEIQIAVRQGLEDKVGEIVTTCAKEAGKPFGFRVPLASEYKTGRSWADCH